MLYCVKIKTSRKGSLYSHKLMLCKKRTPRIGFVFSKVGYLNNYFNSFNSRNLFLNLKQVLNLTSCGYKMNRAAYKNIGYLFKYEKFKERRHH
jgi:hypothetical protein